MTCPRCGSPAERETLTITRDGVTTTEVWLRCKREPTRLQTAQLRFGKWTRCPVIKEVL